MYLHSKVYQVTSIGHQLADFETVLKLLSDQEVQDVRQEYATYIANRSNGLGGKQRKSSKKHRKSKRRFT